MPLLTHTFEKGGVWRIVNKGNYLGVALGAANLYEILNF